MAGPQRPAPVPPLGFYGMRLGTFLFLLYAAIAAVLTITVLCKHSYEAGRTADRELGQSFEKRLKPALDNIVGMLMEMLALQAIQMGALQPHDDGALAYAVLIATAADKRENELAGSIKEAFAGVKWAAHDDRTRLLAVRLSATLGLEHPELAEIVAKGMSDPDERVRATACDGLGEWGNRGRFALPLLEHALHDNSAHVRMRAAKSVWQLSDEDAPPNEILSLLDDCNETVRLEAARVAAFVGSKSATLVSSQPMPVGNPGSFDVRTALNFIHLIRITKHAYFK